MVNSGTGVKNGEIYAELNTTSAVRDAFGNTEYYVSLFSDITPMKEYERPSARSRRKSATPSIT